MKRLVVGDRLAGRYQIRAMTSERPTGLLLRGYDEQIGVEVALRIIDADLLVDDNERRVFVQRATRARALQHPNLIRLYDVLVDDDAAVLVMQWAPGERLSTRLAKGPLNLAEARVILRRSAAGIAHAHQHGVVLGNVRADTVVLYPDGLKLTNVGIGPALPRQRFLAAMKENGAFDLLAPELQNGQDPDERSDVYALAALARTLFTREAEPGAPNPAEAARPVLDRVLSAAPAARPKDAEALARELDAVLDGKSLSTRSYAAVPTGSDTERIERVDLAELTAQERALPRAAAADLDLEHHTTSTEELTNAQGPRSREKAVELAVEDLVEVKIGADAGEGDTGPLPRYISRDSVSPDVTDVGYRSPVQMPAPVPSSGRFASAHTPTAGLPALPPRVVPAVPVAPAVPVVAAKPAPVIARAPVAPRPAGPVPTKRGFAPLAEEPPEESTRKVPRIEIDPGPLPVGVERPPAVAEKLQSEPYAALPPSRRDSRRMIALLLMCGVGIGAIGAVALWRYSPKAPVVAEPVTPSPSPLPNPSRSPSPSPNPSRLPNPSRSPIPPPPPSPPPTACPLGMAELSGSHSYCIDLYEYPGGRTIPRTQISLADAAQICASRSLRLCTDAEWERACRGPSGSSYPYGQSFDSQRCNTGSKLGGNIEPAGTRARCRSASGAYDMSGNVAEWTSSGAQRGASANGAGDGRCSRAARAAPASGAPDVGFRCCGDLSR